MLVSVERIGKQYRVLGIEYIASKRQNSRASLCLPVGQASAREKRAGTFFITKSSQSTFSLICRGSIHQTRPSYFPLPSEGEG